MYKLANFDDKDDVNIDFFIQNLYKGLKTSMELNKLKEKECISKYLNLIFINDIPLKKSFEKL